MKKIAQDSGRPAQEINREFVLQRFLARIFRAPDAPWVLKGGTGLLVRLPRARYSDDVDLLYPTNDVDLVVPVRELRDALAEPCGNDFFRFEPGRIEERAAADGEKAVATARVPPTSAPPSTSGSGSTCPSRSVLSAASTDSSRTRSS